MIELLNEKVHSGKLGMIELYNGGTRIFMIFGRTIRIKFPKFGAVMFEKLSGTMNFSIFN